MLMCLRRHPAGTRTARRLHGNHFSNQGDALPFIKESMEFFAKAAQCNSIEPRRMTMFGRSGIQTPPTCHRAKRPYLTPNRCGEGSSLADGSSPQNRTIDW